MSCELTIQHPDFTHEELGEIEEQDVRARILDHPWAEEFEARRRQLAENGRACPPSVYIAKREDYCLHVYATAEDAFEVAVLVPRPLKLWRFIPLAPTSSIIRAADTLEELLPVVDAFVANDAAEMMELFDFPDPNIALADKSP